MITYNMINSNFGHVAISVLLWKIAITALILDMYKLLFVYYTSCKA